MDTTPDTNTTLYDACLAEAASGGRKLMEAMVAETRQSLQQLPAMRTESLERDALTESLRQLSAHEQSLYGAYPEALLAAFTGDDASAKPKAAALSFDELELMDDSQVQESVELARAQQSALLATEAPLATFNALICAVQGLKTVQPDRNPLRPEVYVRALRNVLKQSGVTPAARLRWLQYMGTALGRELADVYIGLSIKLREAGVTAAGYAVTQTAGPGTASAAGGSAVAGPAGGGQAASGGASHGAPSQEETLLTVRQLRRLLTGELDGDAAKDATAAGGAAKAAPPRSDFNFTVPAAFEALQEMKQVDKVMNRLAARGASAAPALPPRQPGAAADVSADPGQPLGSLKQYLRTDARGVGQALGLEVVNIMVENIASDARLLPPVQEVVRDLEPALLRLVMIDPRFFSDKLHPARRLLEQITQRSLAWQDEDAAGFKAFMEPLDEAVQVLARLPIDSVEPFDFALRTLQETWNEQQRREKKQRETAVKSLLQAEQRNLLAGKIAQEIRGRADVAQAPREMLEFLTGPWAQVMAQARLSDQGGAADPGGYQAAINDLIWSAQPELARNSIPRLTRLIGPLLATLRHGLASIAWPDTKASAFFNTLMSLHQQALRPAGTAGASPAEAPRPATREELDARFDTAPSEPWLAPAEARESGFMDTEMFESRETRPMARPAAGPAFAPTQAGFNDTQPFADSRAPRPAREAHADERTGDLIPTGSWVEFLVGDRATRTQLTWASPHGTLFMFTNAEGGTHSMTRKSLDRLLADGGLRVISGSAVVDQALDAVAEVALRNSLDLSL